MVVCFIWGHSIGLYATWDPPWWPQEVFSSIALQPVGSQSVTIHPSFLPQLLNFALLMELHEVSVSLIPSLSLTWKWYFSERYFSFNGCNTVELIWCGTWKVWSTLVANNFVISVSEQNLRPEVASIVTVLLL